MCRKHLIFKSNKEAKYLAMQLRGDVYVLTNLGGYIWALDEM